MKIKPIFALCAVLGLAACETTTAIPYQASTQNVISAQRTLKPADTKVTLGAFTSSGKDADKPTCRAMGQLDVAPGKSVEAFIRDAFQSELFMAGAYDETSGTSISGHVDRVDVNSMGTGSWTIAITVKSTKYPEGYSVTTTFPFASSFSAVSACKNAAAAFNPAVQDLLGKVVNHPNFGKLTGAR
jgi:hypothetical protein